LSDIQAEFGGTNPVSLSEYYKGGAFVSTTDFAPNVPSSGQINILDFYGAASTTQFSSTFTVDTDFVLPAGFVAPANITVLGGGGGAGGNDAGTAGHPGYAGKIVTANITGNPGDIIPLRIGGGGGGGRDGAIATPGAGGSSSVGYAGGTGGASVDLVLRAAGVVAVVPL